MKEFVKYSNRFNFEVVFFTFSLFNSSESLKDTRLK